MDRHFIEQAVTSYGYWALFAGTFFEGETFFLLGGIAARRELLNPFYVAMAAMAGGFIGDQCFFFLGRWKGDRALRLSRRLNRKAGEIRGMVRRHAVPLILLSRFLYGLRMVIPMACGVSRIAPWRFLALNFISALLWTMTFGGLGYFFGGWLSDNMGALKNLQIVAAVVLGMLLACMLAGRMIKKSLAADSGDDPPQP